MGRSYKAEGINATRKYLTVYVVVDSGASKRFVSIKIPWELVAAQYNDIVEQCERIFTERLKAEVEGPFLPLESWE